MARSCVFVSTHSPERESRAELVQGGHSATSESACGRRVSGFDQKLLPVQVRFGPDLAWPTKWPIVSIVTVSEHAAKQGFSKTSPTFADFDVLAITAIASEAQNATNGLSIARRMH